jgi:origin recognition complex subunit 1
MSKTQAKFIGWKFDFEEKAVANHSHVRSKRGIGASENLTLTRQSDGLEVKIGDTLLAVDTENNEGPPIVLLVISIALGVDDYIVVNAMNLLRLSEVQNAPESSLSQEVFFTTVIDKIYVADIIESANVLNAKDFSQVVIDASNIDNTFLCRKGYDTYYHTYTPDVDFSSIKEGVITNPQAQIDYLRSISVKSQYPRAQAPTNVKLESQPVKPKPTSSPKPKSSSANRPRPTRSSVSTEEEQKVIPAKRQRLKEVVISDDDDDDELDGYKPVSKDKLDDSLSEGEINSDDSIEDSEPLFSSEDDFTAKTPSDTPGHAKASFFRPLKKKVHRGPKFLAGAKGKIVDVDTGGVVKYLPCRESQFEDIYDTVKSSIEADSGTVVYVYGPPGTGKTVTIREVVKELHREAKASALPSFDYIEINGLKLLTPQSIYEALWNKISNDRKVAAKNLGKELEHYFSSGEAKIPLVVLVDELDQLASTNQSILYNIFNWPGYEESKLIVIAASNTMDLPERILTNKTSSRLGLVRFPFPSYEHNDLIKIIKHKLETIDHEGVRITDDSIEYASRKVANVSGDARKALRIIKRAFEIAQEGRTDETKEALILPPHINRAISESSHSAVANYILNLTFVGKMILIGILVRKRKSGLPQNSLGDIIDEIKQIITLNAAKNSSQFVIEGTNILEVLYEDFIIRPKGFAFVLNELIEAGLISQRNLKTERNSLVELKVAETEIVSVLQKQSSLKFFADLVRTDN